MRPVAGAGEDRDDEGALAWSAFDREVVDVAAASPFVVEELVIEDVSADMELAHQFCPTLVISIKGIAEIAITMITIR